MRLYRTLAHAARSGVGKPRAVAIGVFDGLHLGHQAIVAQARAAAGQCAGSTLVFSFEPTPREFFEPASPPARLTRFRERFELLAAYGADELFCPPFRSIRDLSPEYFAADVLAKALRAAHVVVGSDFKFGAGRRGTLADLRRAAVRLGFEITEVQPVYRNGERVSSTAIRAALRCGDLATAATLLGRNYSISGRVVRGLGLGKDLGFPTANVHLKRLQAPVDGIFAARVGGLGSELRDGIASVGTRPTVGGGEALLEVFVFDFDGDLYGRHITVQFVKRLREERHFTDLKAMQRQMHIDVADAKAALTDSIA